MSNYTQSGQATVYGVDGNFTYDAIPTTASYLWQSTEFTHNTNTQELKDSDGKVVGLGASDEQFDLVIDMAPATTGGASNTKANAQGALVLPTSNTKVTIAGMANAQMNGDYSYLGGGRIRQTNEGHAVMTLPLKRFAAGPFEPVS